MEINEIKQKTVHGDLVIAGKMIGITRDNAKVALKRVGSKYHERVKEALVKIINSREALIKESAKK